MDVELIMDAVLITWLSTHWPYAPDLGIVRCGFFSLHFLRRLRVCIMTFCVVVGNATKSSHISQLQH